MNSIEFNEIVPVWLIFSVALVMGIYLIRKEIQRSSKTKIPRIIAQLIVLASLAALSLRPSLPWSQYQHPMILLTNGFDTEIADSLQVAYPDAMIKRMTEEIKYGEAPLISSLKELFDNKRAINFILGEGLSPALLDIHSEFQFKFFPGKKSAGVTALRIDPGMVNHLNHLSGRFNHNKGSVLTLFGPGGAEDSIQLKQNDEIPFSLSFTPRQSGTFVYRLTTRDSLGSSQTENLPIEVQPERKLKILAILRYPTFEIRYLKNFLSEKGHGVVLRYQVSKNRFRYEYVNQESIKIDPQSAEFFDDFDLVCIPVSDLEQLHETEATNLKNAIRSGLGLIILYDKIPENKSLEPFLQSEFVKTNSDTLRVAFRSIDPQTLSALGAQFKSTVNFETLMQSTNRQLLTGYKFEGLGKIGVQMLKETFSLQLRGQAEAYGEVWTPLLEQTAREEGSRYKINVKTFPGYTNDPIDIEIISAGEMPEASMDNIPVPLTEDVLIDDYWHGRIWVGSPGWHQVQIKGDSTRKNFFVNEKSAWKALAMNDQLLKNRLRDYDGDLPSNSPIQVLKPVSVWIWFTLILIAFGYLWLEPRI